MIDKVLINWQKICIMCIFIKIKHKLNKWGGKVNDEFWDR